MKNKLSKIASEQSLTKPSKSFISSSTNSKSSSSISTLPYNYLNKSTYQQRAFFKVIIIGDLGVGKTTLISQFLKDFLKPNRMCKIKMDFSTKEMLIDDTLVEMQIWDTFGQEEFFSLTKQYYRDCNGCLLMFDLSNKESFAHINKWNEDIKTHANTTFPIVLVGNKVDQGSDREVSNKAQEYAKKEGYDYIEGSAKQMTNVKKVFHMLGKKMIEHYNNHTGEIGNRRKPSGRQKDVRNSYEEYYIDNKCKNMCC